MLDLSQPGSRRRLLGAAGIAAAAGTLALGRKAEAQSIAWMQPGNNSHVLALQAGDAAAAGTVRLDSVSHSDFRLTTPRGLTIMLDPWRNDPSGAWGLWYPNEFPKHCLNTATTITLSTLESAEEGVTAQTDKEMLGAASLELKRSEIAGMDRRFLYFGDHVVTA